jgi:aspergillopepsin I
MLLPHAAVEAYYAHVPGADNNETEGGFVFPCSSPLPDITLTVAEFSLIVLGTLMNRSGSLTLDSTACYDGIQTGEDNLAILGDVFLKSQFVVFEAREWDNEPRLGFAKQVG